MSADSLVNRQFRLASRPQGMVTRENFEVVQEPVAEPGGGEVLVKTQYISLDPAMRGWMAEGRSYIPPVQIGEVMRAGMLGEVIASAGERFSVGDHVTGWLGVQEYAVCPESAVFAVDPAAAPLTTYLGALGMPGMTAYFGLLDVAEPKKGETVVVSGAAGAVGSVVGQIARIKGCRAIGIAGGPEKCEWVAGELGFDACIDYKSADVARALREHCPEGIDVYFDNVGGEISAAVHARLNVGARIAICGQVSQYNAVRPEPSFHPGLLIVFRAKMQGFLVSDYAARFDEAARRLARWVAEGKLQWREDVTDGLENAPRAFLGMLRGENRGKALVKVADRS
jgi:NADPH-dependent curcumin reductase CurA